MTDREKVKTSIIVPCYNQSNYVQQLLFNVSKATSQLHEVIIVNDGSTELNVIEKLDAMVPAAPHQNIRVVHKKNGGLSSARNEGLKYSTGDFIQLLDSDDLLAPGKIDRQIEVISNHKLDYHLCNWVAADENISVFTAPNDDTIGPYELSFESIALNWERGMSIPIHCALFSKNILEDMEFDVRLKAKEDWFFWMKLFRKNPEGKYWDFAGAIYRQHAEAMTKSNLSGMGIAWLEATNLAQKEITGFSEEMADAAIEHFCKFYWRHFFILGGKDMFEDKCEKYIFEGLS